MQVVVVRKRACDHRTHTRSRSEVGDDAHGETSAIEDGDHEGSSSSGGTSADEVEAGKAELKPMHKPSPQGKSSLRRRVATAMVRVAPVAPTFARSMIGICLKLIFWVLWAISSFDRVGCASPLQIPVICSFLNFSRTLL